VSTNGLNCDDIGLAAALRDGNGTMRNPNAAAEKEDTQRATMGMRVAVVHEWLATCSGSEQVLAHILALYPDADLFAIVDFIPQSQRAFLEDKKVHVSFLQYLPLARKGFRWYLPLMPFAIEQFDLSAYDLIISSSHAVSKGVLTRSDQLHISYVYTPFRYAWDLQEQYLARASGTGYVKSAIARLLMHYLRIWDVRTASGVDRFVAVSHCVARRIMKTYRRRATVLYPPVHLDQFTPCVSKGDFFVTVSRLVPYKRVELLLEAFAMIPQSKLVVIGDGPELGKLRRKAPPNVAVKGHLPMGEMRGYLARAKAFVYAGEEDFGISMVEAQACGTPVLAFARGGAAEIVLDGETGILFDSQTPEAIVKAIQEFERRGHFDPARCRENSIRFSVDRFREGFRRLVNETLREHQIDIRGLSRYPFNESGYAPVRIAADWMTRDSYIV
jgi:glycosyltransferase involved in cell wall biosynthesis